MSEDQRMRSRNVLGVLYAIGILCFVSLWVFLGFFYLVRITEEAFFSTSYMNFSRELALSGWCVIFTALLLIRFAVRNDWFYEE